MTLTINAAAKSFARRRMTEKDLEQKIRNVAHDDTWQMNLYLNYFKTEETVEGDNESIGIILFKKVFINFALFIPR
ncbi:MAG: hypothetical protein QM763_21795 [Agriterribacter sp.]